ncbi:histidinol-phosphate transaminase [Gaertneriomyces sp. JEL0708]|nr:histidinol-phosphate transaminase [Gaertneriomyces sp. JEL0708]
MGRSNFDLKAVVRPNIWALQPYRCARDDYSAGILLDANENSFGPSLPAGQANQVDAAFLESQLERYPDPYQKEIKESLASFRGLPSTSHFFLGVGSDESLDLLIRVFCVPGKDKILICPPTYGMYSVCAQVNDVEVVKVPLDVAEGRFQPQTDKIIAAVEADPTIKLVFLCSPGNPTGTLLRHDDIKRVLDCEAFKGVVVVDEAYVDFCAEGSSVAHWVVDCPNLVVTQTLSKSFGLAGIRLGIAIASPDIAQILNNTKAPYNISTPTSLLARAALSEEGINEMRRHITSIISERSRLLKELESIAGIGKVIGNNDANFVLAPILGPNGKPDNTAAHKVYKALAEEEGVVVRYRGAELGCQGCLRITIGTERENRVLLEKLRKLTSSM